MNRTVAPAAVNRTMGYYRAKEQAVFSSIPGMDQLLSADFESAQELQAQYPDAAFALMTSDRLFAGDHEQNIIHQEAYAAILRGEPLASVRFRFEKDMDAYVQRHMWD